MWDESGVGVVPATEPFKDVSGINIDKREYIHVDSKTTIHVLSIFAAGDIVSFPLLTYGLGHQWSLGADCGHVPGKVGCSQHHRQGERCSHCPLLLDCPRARIRWSCTCPQGSPFELATSSSSSLLTSHCQTSLDFWECFGSCDLCRNWTSVW